MSQTRPELIRAAYQAEHADQVMTWQDLEKKAQATVTIAGVFLAAVVAFARDSSTLVVAQQVVLTATLMLLVASVLAAAISMKVTDYPGPPGGPDIGEISEANADDTAFHAAVVAKWECQIDNLAKVNKSKVSWLGGAQLSLYLAVIAAAIAAVMRIWISV